MGRILFTPWMEAQGISQEADRVLQRLVEHRRMRAAQREATAEWNPPADIYETAENVVIQVELAGVQREKIVLELRDNMLLLTGERRFERDANALAYHLLERSRGTFVRSFPLPHGIDPDAVSASLNDGVLTITAPKETPVNRQRTIRVGQD